MASEPRILLDSGSNEVEILEFILGGQSYGLNVLKVKQIIKLEMDQLIDPPDAPPSVMGMLRFHGKVIPIVDLKKFFKRPAESLPEVPVAIITEFNEGLHGFMVDGLNKIQRVSWEKLQPVEDMMSMPYIIGTITIDERTILIVDFESIVSEIFGSVLGEEAPAAAVEAEPETIDKRGQLKIFASEDSATVRAVIQALLHKYQYTNLTLFTNGQDLFDAVMDADHQNKPHVVLTDIEMPKMDGLTLCKSLKESQAQLPVIVMSSLISKQILTRCEQVHADHAISKKRMGQVIPLLDELTKKLS